MSIAVKRFAAGFFATALATVFFNLLPYLWTRGAYHGDGFEVVGFPFIFRRLGGMAGFYEFRIDALVADVVLGLGVAIFVGFYCASVGLRRSIRNALRKFEWEQS